MVWLTCFANDLPLSIGTTAGLVCQSCGPPVTDQNAAPNLRQACVRMPARPWLKTWVCASQLAAAQRSVHTDGQGIRSRPNLGSRSACRAVATGLRCFIWERYGASTSLHICPLGQDLERFCGSITSGQLALQWKRLEFDGSGVANQLCRHSRQADRPLTSRPSMPGCPTRLAGFDVASALKQQSTAPQHSRICPTSSVRHQCRNVQSGALWRFLKPTLGTGGVVQDRHPAPAVAVAVPPPRRFRRCFPRRLNFARRISPRTGADLQRLPYPAWWY